MMTLDAIKNETIWVAKMVGYRLTGTYAEMKKYAEREDCRDFDVCATQPTKELQEFWNACWKYEEETHRWLMLDEFYEIWASDATVRNLGIEN